MKKIVAVILPSLMAAALCTAVRAAPLSTAFSNIAAKLEMNCTADAGADIVFTAEDFDRLIGAQVDAVRILSVPSSAFGRLTLGTQQVIKGQTVSRGYLGMLKFVPTLGKAAECSFSFAAQTGDSEYEMICRISIGGGNAAEEASSDESGAAQVPTAGLHLIFPQINVTRSEFLRAVMTAAGYDLSGVKGSRTSFWDDDDIPEEDAAYVAEAKRIGAVCGGSNAMGKTCFFPLDPITAKEADTIVARISGGSVQAMASAGKRSAGSDASSPVTVKDLARIIESVRRGR